MIKVGQKVRTNLGHAWVYRGTEKWGKMGKPRTGTIEHIPPATRDAGEGTIYVRWDSLDGSPNDDDRNWLMWVHTDLCTIDTKEAPGDAKV